MNGYDRTTVAILASIGPTKNMSEAKGLVWISDTSGSKRRYAYIQIIPSNWTR